MTRAPSAAHLRLWMKRQKLPAWAAPELIHRVNGQAPNVIDECVNINAEDAGFIDAGYNRRQEVDDTLSEICGRMHTSSLSMADIIQDMLSGDATRRDGDLQKWLRRLRPPGPDDILHMWQCYSCFQCFERRPRRRCPECGAATSHQSRPA